MFASTPDTILAVSSPPGRSPRGMIRLSGMGLLEHLSVVIADESTPAPRALTAVRLPLEHRTLPALVLCFAAPHSYTGEDVVELQVPGHPALLDRLLHEMRQRLNAAGLPTRLAEPGEFTRRAFTNQRLDLTEAEGVAATIGAVSDAQLQAAGMLRRGRLGDWSSQQTEALARSLALVEAGIDFVDQEDVVPITPRDLDQALGNLEAALDHMLSRSRPWAQLDALPRVVLAGPPNAGKSTLFNRLLGRQRAVTSDQTGTTRDVLTEPWRAHTDIGEIEVLLQDVAGLETLTTESTEHPLHPHMQTAARDALRAADLVLLLSEDGRFEDISPFTNAPTLRLRTKSDQAGAAVGHTTPSNADLSISAATGAGLDDLRRRIVTAVRHRAVSVGGEVLALQPRHREHLTEARDAIHRTRALVAPQRDAPVLADTELIAVEMRLALDQLGGLAGRISPDDLIGRIFATFCIGK